ncbi:hypothetical protein COK81_09035 [Bacillus thuringiensis]|uniref:Phage protein n=1 Tax=Bacillus thuringiensis TaxID=1428 RepID=A0A9X7G2R7_BACTU|nr:hypothetical protein [Bacillus thuringiensis]PFT96413.1 hypothetical protein COK81_09035 [Bacillus thuringiensis]
MTNEIILTDGEVVKINPNLTAWTLFNLEKEGIIGKSFLSTLLDTRGDAGNVHLLDTFCVVYAAYRQATVSDYMDFESFMQKYEVDMTEAFKIFGSVLKKQKDKNNMAKGFQQKAGKKA